MISRSLSRVGFEISGIIAIAAAIFLLLSLVSFSPSDPSFSSYQSSNQVAVSNNGGLVGAFAADLLTQLAGALSYIVVLVFALIGITLIKGGNFYRLSGGLLGLLLFTISSASLLNIYLEKDPLFSKETTAGLLGEMLGRKLALEWLALYGSTILLVALLIISFLIIGRVILGVRFFATLIIQLEDLFDSTKILASKLASSLASFAVKIDLKKYIKSFNNRSIKKSSSGYQSRLEDSLQEYESSKYDHHVEFRHALTKDLADKNSIASSDDLDGKSGEDLSSDDFEDKLPVEELNSILASAATSADNEIIADTTLTQAERLEGEEELEDDIGILEPFENSRISSDILATDTEQQEFFSGKDVVPYRYPSLDLLDENEDEQHLLDRGDLIRSSRILEKKLADFGIEGKVKQVRPGPVITIYEYEPARGVKVSRIVSLSDDLAMSLRATSIRIEAPIPGRSVVGIEAPTLERENVYLSDLLASQEFIANKGSLPLVLGKDVSGRPQVADLAKIPHLLIAGSTGSGKSVGLNAMICSLLFTKSPEDVRFIFIDPKMLELSIYNGVPHLLTPVITEVTKAATSLKWVVSEMEARYKLLSTVGVRNIVSFNDLVRKNQKNIGANSLSEIHDSNEQVDKNSVVEKLPYIVVVIDELADLMMIASKEVEDSLSRIAQMARAAGIHIIAATQRPSVDVLTGLIKANFPARISFQVRSRTDSRTILDSMGAEKLLGRGDMLYLPPGVSNPTRIQAPFVSDDEIHRVVNFIKSQRPAEYDPEIDQKINLAGNSDIDEFDEESDELYDKAVDFVQTVGHASISMVQRKLRIGYNRAARIVEFMEKEGVVGPSDGAKPREVFIKLSDRS